MMKKIGFWKGFGTGIATSIIGSIVCYFLINYFIEPMRLSLSFGFPPVAGKYQTIFLDKPEWEPETAYVHQTGFSIRGNFFSPHTDEQYSLKGNVTSSRIISYQFRPKNSRLNDYGSGLIRLNRDGNGGEGYVLILSEDDERPEPIRVRIKRVGDE